MANDQATQCRGDNYLTWVEFGFGLCLYGGVAAPVVGGVQELALRLGQGEELACSGAGGEDLGLR